MQGSWAGVMEGAGSAALISLAMTSAARRAWRRALAPWPPIRKMKAGGLGRLVSSWTGGGSERDEGS